MILFIFVLLKPFLGFIIHDTNTFKVFDFDYTSFTCENGHIQTATINFSGTFANVPQVILTFVKYGILIPPNIKFSIVTVSVTDFSVQIECLQNRVYRYQVKWYAIDDPRLEVINYFNQIPTLTKTFSHQIPNAFYGFISITSFTLTGVANFILSISSITSTSVTVDLSSITNLVQIGYQIILGVDSSFNSYTMKSLTTPYTSPSIRIERNKFFLLPMCGLNFPNQDTLRIEKLYTISGDYLIYSVSNWDGLYTPNYHLEIQIPFDYITISKALKASHLQITAYEEITQTLNSNFQIKIKEINQIYENTGTFQFEIDDTISTVNIDVLIKCSQNNQITAKLNYCGLCSNQGRYELQRSCYGTINRYNFRSRFKTSLSAKKLFTITITQQSFQITQLVYTETQISVLTQLNIFQMTLQNA